MVTLATTNLTLADWARRKDPNGKVDYIVEQLNQTNEILDDMVFVEGNLPTGHKTTVRTGLPSATWRMLNYGVQPSKSTTAQVVDTCGMLEAYCEVDKDLADLNGNTAEFRLSEDKAFLEAMNQAVGSTVFYGNTTQYPERFMGMSPRFNALSGSDSSANIINASGSSALTSIWMVHWGDNTCHGIFPKGSQAGFNHTDLGEQTLVLADGSKYQGYRSHYKWNIGMCVRDWRYVVRIANVDTSALTKNAGSGADLIDLMTQAIELLPEVKSGKPAFYVNRTVRSFLRRQMANKAVYQLEMGEIMGKRVLSFDGIPVRRCDQILNTESAIS